MKNLLIILFVSVVAVGCNINYQNDTDHYINIGDEFSLYYSTNSCCQYCIVNETKLKHVKLIGSVNVGKTQNDCDGCNTQRAYKFKGMSAGVDTIYLKEILATENCSSISIDNAETYFVHIK